MKSVNRAVLLAFALASTPGAALATGSEASSTQGIRGAAEGARDAETFPSFSETDQNNNGIIERSEAATAGVDMISADTNEDGQLDRKEWERAVPAPERKESLNK